MSEHLVDVTEEARGAYREWFRTRDVRPGQVRVNFNHGTMEGLIAEGQVIRMQVEDMVRQLEALQVNVRRLNRR